MRLLFDALIYHVLYIAKIIYHCIHPTANGSQTEETCFMEIEVNAKIFFKGILLLICSMHRLLLCIIMQVDGFQCLQKCKCNVKFIGCCAVALPVWCHMGPGYLQSQDIAHSLSADAVEPFVVAVKFSLSRRADIADISPVYHNSFYFDQS